MRNELYFKEIKNFETKYFSIITSFNTNFPRALNLQEEKKKFFKAIADDKVYNPQLIYEKKVFDEKKIIALKKLRIDTSNDIYGFKKLYKKRLKDKIYEIECHRNWGLPISTKYVMKYRGYPSVFLLSKAKVYCKNYTREKVKFRRITPHKIGTELKKEVLNLTNNPIQIKFEQIPSNININPLHNLVTINPNSRHTTLDLERLKVHEVGVHYMRYFNGLKTGIKILASGTSNYIETEEGLAVYAEDIKGVSSKAQMFIYAGRVIASYYAPKKSFYDIYQILRSYGFKRDDAFSITFRVKRNISNTSKKGGFTKDYVYFKGYLKVKNYAKKHDIRDLFIGKIRVEDTKLLKKFIKKHRQEITTIFD